MRLPPYASVFLLLTAFGTLDAQQPVAELLQDPALSLHRPADRARVVARMAELENNRRQRALAKAKLRGIPMRRILSGGRIQEIVDFDGNHPLYLSTDNVTAAISTGVSQLRTSPYSLNGTGITIGLWDAGSARSTHQEFGTRFRAMDSGIIADHATHVGGTLAASGVIANARGMAEAAQIQSYDWTNDISEMTNRGATAPGQADKLYLSNHSYNYISGWNLINGGSPTRVWEWNGSGTSSSSVENDFGAYNSLARDQDLVAFDAPYYLIFRSAGNDRNNNPATGQMISLAPGGSTVVAYNPSSHPAGDGTYLGGFGTISFSALSKNIITVGSTLDAVTSGVRDVSKASINVFSAWGPTDDGRIKPDVVANGHEVYSSIATSNSSYATYSGTSMATPNACGSAALLVQQYSTLFPGQAMRSSTLKSLLIHTADDRGNVGPDYKFGWGLVNVKAAADHIRDHAAAPLRQRIIESQVSSTITSRNHFFVWDGVSPIKATLGWTDPAGNSQTVSDSRNASLVNNLNLKIVGPNGSEHFPFVMPFVGTWTQASMDAPAITGVNQTDNTEQVRITTPPVAGVYRIQVTYSGPLANNNQNYSLILSGAAAELAPLPPLALSAVSPSSALSAGDTIIELTGSYLETATGVRLTRTGQADTIATSMEMNAGNLQCQFDLTGMTVGAWNVVVLRSGSEPAILAGSFHILGALLNENFEGTTTGWTSVSTLGTNAWAPTTTQSYTAAKSWFAAAPGAKTTTYLNSPSIAIPSDASNLQLRFWHSYNFQASQDGGRLEFSLNGGSWIDAEALNSGASFVENGYTNFIRTTSSSQFASLASWTNNSNGWLQTVIDLSQATFAGKTLRMRWGIATDNTIASAPWYLDSISILASFSPPNQAPVIVSAPSTTSSETQIDPYQTIYQVIRGASTTLDVIATDDGGESALSFAWSHVEGPGAPVSFSSNSSKSTAITFFAAGDYLLQAMVTDAQGLSATGTVNVRVLRSPTAITMTPSVAIIQFGSSVSCNAALSDQFGTMITNNPPAFTWTQSGGGTVNPLGVYQAMAAGGPYLITATNGNLNASSSITVSPVLAGITLTSLIHSYDGLPKQASVSTSPPNLPVMITYNGSETNPNLPGNYSIVATIVDPNYTGFSTETLVIDAPVGWGTWTGQHFTPPESVLGNANENSDPDGDGLPNLAEYAIGTDPCSFTPPMIPIRNGAGLSFTFTRPAAITDVTCIAESWDGNGEWAPALLELVTDGTIQTWRARDPLTSGNLNKRFLRLRFIRD